MLHNILLVKNTILSSFNFSQLINKYPEVLQCKENAVGFAVCIVKHDG